LIRDTKGSSCDTKGSSCDTAQTFPSPGAVVYVPASGRRPPIPEVPVAETKAAWTRLSAARAG